MKKTSFLLFVFLLFFTSFNFCTEKKSPENHINNSTDTHSTVSLKNSFNIEEGLQLTESAEATSYNIEIEISPVPTDTSNVNLCALLNPQIQTRGW